MPGGGGGLGRGLFGRKGPFTASKLRFPLLRLQLGNNVHFNPLNHGGVGELYAPPFISFCHLLKIIVRHSNLKILDHVSRFVADAPMKKCQEI